MSQTVRNRSLYRRLQQLYGKVKVYNAGVPLWYEYEQPPIIAYDPNPRMVLEVQQHGEQYRISCPCCNDTTYRCYVNHKFGEPDSIGRVITLIKCYNNNCFSNRNNVFTMLNQLLALSNGQTTATLAQAAEDWFVPEEVAVPPEWPGDMVSLNDLLVSQPGHQAVQYMLGRGYTAEQFSKFQLAYCPRSHKFPVATDRIIVPAFKEGQLWGWQARQTFDSKAKGALPKYITMTGMKKGDWLYNFDIAKDQDRLVVVEAPFSVHFLGDCSAATFGKDVSKTQLSQIVRYGQRKPIIVWLDMDAQDKAKAACKHLQMAGLRVYNVDTQTAMNAADYRTAAAWSIINNTVAAGVQNFV